MASEVRTGIPGLMIASPGQLQHKVLICKENYAKVRQMMAQEGESSMYKAKVTSKGQITIPSAVRDALGLKPGEKVAFLAGENGEFRLRRVGSIMDMYGCLAGLDLPKTNAELDEMMAEIAAELDKATKSDARPASDSEAA